MRLTKRGDYPLRTLIRLGIAKRMEEGMVSAAGLALQEKLPFRFLEAILFKLCVNVTLRSRECDSASQPNTRKKRAETRHTDPADAFLAVLLSSKPA